MSVIEKLRIWGVKGAIDYIFNQFRCWRIKRIFLDNAKRFPYNDPLVGITVVGNLSDCGSLSKVLRDFCFSLKDAGIPFQTYDLGSNNVPNEDIAPILTPVKDFRIAKYTNLVEMVCSPVPDGIVRHRSRIVFWEFESGLSHGYPILFECLGDIVGLSDFNYNYYKIAFRDKRSVKKILYPFRMVLDAGLSVVAARARFNIPRECFVVFYNFSYKSGIDRKNPEGAIRAFAKAFANNGNARIVFKTMAAAEYPQRVGALKMLAESLGVMDKVDFVDEYLTQHDVFTLTNACDVYLSLHRAEGFGLGIAEAMALGKPVVVTNYSAPTEFCNESNSIPIGFKLVPFEASDNKLYNAADKWAAPDIDEAARALLRLYGDANLRMKLGAKAREFIMQRYSISKFRESVTAFLGVGAQ